MRNTIKVTIKEVNLKDEIIVVTLKNNNRKYK